MRQALRVLALTASNPEKHYTWRLRVELLLPHLAARQIHVATWRLGKNRSERCALFDSLRGFDIVWIHRALLWPSELRRLRRVARHMVLDIDDPVCYSSSNLGNFSLPRCLKFRATVRRCDAVVAASDGLVTLAANHNGNAFLLPLCAEPARYAMHARPRLSGEPLRLLWLGGKSTFKYLEHVRPQLEAVGRECPQAELVVVAHSRFSLTSMPVTNRPWNPENEREQLTRCHVGLVPMARDRWTQAKAALKPLQYLASGMPFIGSKVGINVRLADQGRNGVLVDDRAEWIGAVRRLHRDEALRQHMGRTGVEYIRRYHAPEVLADRVAEIFHSLSRQAAAA
jgi:glycosyltransferase involved in cell wall biosynthesis